MNEVKNTMEVTISPANQMASAVKNRRLKSGLIDKGNKSAESNIILLNCCSTFTFSLEKK